VSPPRHAFGSLQEAAVLADQAREQFDFPALCSFTSSAHEDAAGDAEMCSCVHEVPAKRPPPTNEKQAAVPGVFQAVSASMAGLNIGVDAGDFPVDKKGLPMWPRKGTAPGSRCKKTVLHSCAKRASPDSDDSSDDEHGSRRPGTASPSSASSSSSTRSMRRSSSREW